MVKVQKLPYLALKCFISHLSPVKKIDFSLCSEKCRKAVKMCTPNDIFYVYVNFEVANSYVSMTTIDAKKYVRVDTMKLSKKLGLANLEKLSTMSLVLPCADYICDVLNSQEVHGIVFSTCSMDMLSNLKSWLTNRQKTLDYCEISQFVPKLQLGYILDNFEAEFLRVHNDYFESYGKPIKSKMLRIEEDSFISQIQIEKSSLTKIELRATDLSHGDINRILKAWVEGSIPNLDLLIATGIDSENSMSIVDGIELTKLDANVRNRYEGIFYDDKVIAGGWDIRRSDGEMATIKVSTNRNDRDEVMFRLVSHSLFLK